MKKLTLSLVLLITATSVAFGKPAYKQWKKGSYEIDGKSVTEGELRGMITNRDLCQTEYMIYNKSDNEDAMQVYLQYYIESHQIRLVIQVVTPEEIDFKVGKNIIELIENGDVVKRVKLSQMTIDGVKQNIYLAEICSVDTRLPYQIKNLSSGHTYVRLFKVYKLPGHVSMSLRNGEWAYNTWMNNKVNQANAEREALKRAEDMPFITYRDGLSNRYEALKKNYNVQYSGTSGVFSIWSKKPAPSTATRFDVCVIMKSDSDMKFWRDTGNEEHLVAGAIQFQLIYPQFMPYAVNVGAIYTEDGMYSLRYPFNFQLGDSFNEQGMKKSRYAIQVVMTPRIVKESDKFESLNKLFNSGKPIYIEFRGDMISPMKYQLTEQDIVRVKDLLKFIYDLQGKF